LTDGTSFTCCLSIRPDIQASLSPPCYKASSFVFS
jgi:hypothetical protein